MAKLWNELKFTEKKQAVNFLKTVDYCGSYYDYWYVFKDGKLIKITKL